MAVVLPRKFYVRKGVCLECFDIVVSNGARLDVRMVGFRIVFGMFPHQVLYPVKRKRCRVRRRNCRIRCQNRYRIDSIHQYRYRIRQSHVEYDTELDITMSSFMSNST